jgi:hypothetical protein
VRERRRRLRSGLSSSAARWPRIPSRRRAVDPVDVPPGVDRDEHQRVVRAPRLVGRPGRNVVESARAELVRLAAVLEHHRALDHGVGLVGAVPVDRHVHRLRACGSAAGWPASSGRRAGSPPAAVGAQLGDHHLPLQVLESGVRALLRGAAVAPSVPVWSCVGDCAERQSEKGRRGRGPDDLSHECTTPVGRHLVCV